MDHLFKIIIAKIQDKKEPQKFLFSNLTFD
jgi:hypothetical protein